MTYVTIRYLTEYIAYVRLLMLILGVHPLRGRGEGVQAQNFWKDDFEPWVRCRGQDMYYELEGGFGLINPMLPT